MTNEGLCIDCLADHGPSCLSCSSPSICRSCIDGWWLGRKVKKTRLNGALVTEQFCYDCAVTHNNTACIDCDQDKCLECKFGWTIYNGQCYDCSNI